MVLLTSISLKFSQWLKNKESSISFSIVISSLVLTADLKNICINSITVHGIRIDLIKSHYLLTLLNILKNMR